MQSLATLLLATGALASPHTPRQAACPPLHVFGARETTAPAGMGTAGSIVDAIVQAHSGATSEAIDYPACGGQAQCGGVAYEQSAAQGTQATASAVNAFNEQCPDAEIVLIGYSQGGQIFDNAMCGDESGNIPLSDAALAQVKAGIFLGDPHYTSGLAYGVGDCQASGFAARPQGFTCPNADKVQLYCDSPDPYCCNGNDANHHQQYGNLYMDQILAFVNERLSS